ncbi:hypothetical protein BN7_5783 [Wickerhamomyces ciferrii]|uniref:Uracil catabolism protein 4 n=1 Tax=Wickerhamomyces ciferrii (strain ATCC 14091 / BCRC 22168 / CBS 111 / JCM 3599 / NBRC 0793 / NRRL Y-1031 F-60-10) TaxID=1206466 RepID=K0KW37_WICCF|nr:uncharacterized protein BN7_5783 [Wickerhamomyces ciferrii]CCH46192.1 hypothetical protein BN7_5783 [Wickerhamomyces ciferrii]
MTRQEDIKHLLTIQSVRERTSPILKLALDNNLDYFEVDLEKVPNVVKYVIERITRDFKDLSRIPPHGRWGHLNAGGHDRVEQLISKWRALLLDDIEIGKRLIDLFVFSVLVDAGAGNEWSYKESDTHETYNRSEGLAVASVDLFKNGKLSNNKEDQIVHGEALLNFTNEDLIDAFQITDSNPLSGQDGRLQLIQNLGKALVKNKTIFGKDSRPGNMIDYLKTKTIGDSNKLDLTQLWNTLMEGFTPIWPKGRVEIDGISLGDSWSLSTISKLDGVKDELDTIVPFHKLTQWLSYSLIVPLERYGYQFQILNQELQTGLPEYRNGGLFYDFGVITLKHEHLARGLHLSSQIKSKTPKIPSFTPDDGVIVEWRAITIGFLDYILPLVNKELNYDLKLPQLIEAGSWKSGREIAAELRPETKGPPIDLYSDGTVF